MSVPEVVREIITRNRSIFDCMKMDLINYTALAVKIQPDVERVLGNPVNLNTVVVAIIRYADSFDVKDEVEEKGLLILNELGEVPGMDHFGTQMVLDEIREEDGRVISVNSYGSGLPSFASKIIPWGISFRGIQGLCLLQHKRLPHTLKKAKRLKYLVINYSNTSGM